MHLAIPNKSHPVLWSCTAAWERDERPPRLYMDRQVRRKTSVRFSRAKPMPPPRFIHKLIDAAGGRRRPSGRQMSLRIKRRDRPFSSFTNKSSFSAAAAAHQRSAQVISTVGCISGVHSTSKLLSSGVGGGGFH